MTRPSRRPAAPVAWRAPCIPRAAHRRRPGRPVRAATSASRLSAAACAAASLLRAVVSSTCANCAACACSARSTELLATASLSTGMGVAAQATMPNAIVHQMRIANSVHRDHDYPRPLMSLSRRLRRRAPDRSRRIHRPPDCVPSCAAGARLRRCAECRRLRWMRPASCSRRPAITSS